MIFTNLVKLWDFFNIHLTILHVTIHFSSDFIFYKTVHQFSKTLNLRLFASQNLRNTKIYEAMENVGIALFYRFCVVAAIITMRLLVLEILCGDESLI